MNKGCPILRVAYLLAKVLGTEKTGGVGIDEARCMETYCGIWSDKKKQCGLIREATNDKTDKD